MPTDRARSKPTLYERRGAVSQVQTPVKHRVNIKRGGSRNIPEIKIELDHVLNQAYEELRAQPSKNALLGISDVYIVDNSLVRDYVHSIYSEYGIPDPLGQRAIGSESHLKSNVSTKLVSYETPDKFSSGKEGRSETRRVNKTAERISRLKRNIRS